ncbi:helix-turn-helix domain-containing protein [Anaerosporobacter sp.]
MLTGKKLQYLRILKGYSQVYIAESIGVSERWIGKVENEGLAPSQEVYDKWLQCIYGNLKPVKKEKVQSPKVANEKKQTVSKKTVKSK